MGVDKRLLTNDTKYFTYCYLCGQSFSPIVIKVTCKIHST